MPRDAMSICICGLDAAHTACAAFTPGPTTSDPKVRALGDARLALPRTAPAPAGRWVGHKLNLNYTAARRLRRAIRIK